MFTAKLREAKDKGDKDPIELLSEGADQNPFARLNKWEDTSPDEMKVFVAHLIVMGILKKNSLEQYWSRDSILNMPFFGHYMSRNRFQNILWNLHISDPVNLALATFVALKFIQVRHLGSHRVMCRKYRMHQKLHALS